MQYLYNGAGGCVGDYDGDGLPDIFLVSEDGKNRLFRQALPWKFEDVTDLLGLGGGDSWGAGATFVDIDNDGDLDLHVSNMGGPDFLYVNNGDGTFREDAKARGLNKSGPSWMANFADFDRDGDLDCYLLTYRLFYVGKDDPKFSFQTVDGKQVVPPEHDDDFYLIQGHPQEAGTVDMLLENDGNGYFRNVSGSSGIGKLRNHGLSATWWDRNNDNWPDLYLANDFKDPDCLWMNQGDRTFKNVLGSSVSYTPWFAMGSDFADLNRDGWFDFFVADMSAMNHYRQKMEMGAMGSNAWFLEWAEPRQLMRNMLYLNTGGDRLLESGYLSGVESTGWTWAVRFADFDCDGWEDTMVTNGMARDVNNSDHTLQIKALNKAKKYEERDALLKSFQKPGSDRNKVFRNKGDLTFEDVSEEWKYNDLTASFGLILADIDRDGDLDAITNNMNQPVGVYRNDLTTGNSSLIELRGRQSNFFGVGARLRLKSASGWQTRMLTLSRGYESGSEPVVHFGLGDDDIIEQLEIDWPSGAKQVFNELPVNYRHIITEPEGDFIPEPARTSPEPRRTLFSQDSLPGFTFVHEEDEFDDYKEQPLLPWRHSRFGPGIAFGDADADGDEDVWVGGATGQAGRLVTRNDDGSWVSIPWGPWDVDSQSEDMGALFFDPDRDGDLDLYVASGGNQAKGADLKPILEDRLYLNVEIKEGDMVSRGFAKADPDPNPEKRAWESSGVVAAADYDRDGDVDLFVGSRVKPGQFHEVPRQRLLRNEGTGLVDVIDDVSLALRDCGMVTGAIWSDVDQDGRLDLLVTNAWGPVRVFKQSESGTLDDFTEEAGLSGAHGWWQGIDGGDFDGDGDMDYIVTNLGQNTKYHASAEHPIQVYLNDFDGDGSCDLVESEFEGETLYPMRGRSCSSQAMPFITEKFKTYHEFASAELAAIYTPPMLETSRVLKFTHLSTSVLINDGEGRFEIQTLPPLAQIAPGFGVAVEDFDGDGNLDAVLAQNFYSPQPETGRMSGGLGLFLKGNGDGTFTEVWPQDSGISIHEDAKSLAIGDLNGDGAPDLVCGVNNGGVKTLINQTRGPKIRWSSLQLKGVPGNPTAFGATVKITTSFGRTLTREVRGGSSYLSQSTAQQFIGLGGAEHVAEVRVTWPDGGSDLESFGKYQTRLKVLEPER
ncbi:FG-GAP-like repeat-containing protein [Verrucomicrobiales bacterium BCK34]|nr:FG-GAP-like repeat-containing protein [Verrucomicrobiales bacterium BCK34]